MARWEATFDALLECYLFYNGERGRSFAEGFARSLAASDPDAIGPGSLWRRLPDRVEAMAFNAEPIYVEPEMMTVVHHAVEGFKPEPLQATDLITQTGFLYLPEPMVMADVHGRTVSTRAFLWAPLTARVRVAGKDEVGEPTDGILLATLHRVGDRDDYSFEKGDPKAHGLTPDTMLLGHVTPWLFGEAHESAGEGDIHPVLHLLQTLWRLMAQTITMKVDTRGPRDARKRAYRAGFPERNLTVVRLRRPRQESDPDREVNEVPWSHRWLVSGHWRNQFFPSLGIHRQIWISPFIKGPADLPLEIRRTRVFEFVQ